MPDLAGATLGGPLAQGAFGVLCAMLGAASLCPVESSRRAEAGAPRADARERRVSRTAGASARARRDAMAGVLQWFGGAGHALCRAFDAQALNVHLDANATPGPFDRRHMASRDRFDGVRSRRLGVSGACARAPGGIERALAMAWATTRQVSRLSASRTDSVEAETACQRAFHRAFDARRSRSRAVDAFGLEVGEASQARALHAADTRVSR